jgi:prepilin-type N-terminal cleavage/methylation domain-containing protein
MHYNLKNIFKHSHKEQGFTLIEVLMALAIFSIGILAVGSMQLKSTGGSTNARILTEASIWGQDRVETLMSVPYTDPNLTAGGAQYTATSGSYDIMWEVWEFGDVTPAGVAAPANNTKIIRVTVTGRDNQRATVTFVRAQDV